MYWFQLWGVTVHLHLCLVLDITVLKHFIAKSPAILYGETNDEN